MQHRMTMDQGIRMRLAHRVDFALQALSQTHVQQYEKLMTAEDAYEQEILWGEWTECFFEHGLISWEGFVAVPLLQQLCLKRDWFDPRPIWEYLLFMASHVERVYFFYDRHAGPDYSAEEVRWKDVSEREKVRPWLRLAFHAFREFVPLMEEKLELAAKAEREVIFKLMWVSLAFGNVHLKAATRLELQNWACAYQRDQQHVHTIPNLNQLGLFKV